jgi:uncharacterized protein
VRICLAEIKHKQGEAARYRFTGPVPDDFDIPGSGEESSLTVEADVSSSGDKVIVKGTLEASYRAECSRCLHPFQVYCKTDFHESFTILRGLVDEEDPAFLAAETANELTVTGEYLYLDEYLRQVFLLAQEYRPLCSPECKGICAGCGVDLNRADCLCTADAQIDLRLLKLKELTSDSND